MTKPLENAHICDPSILRAYDIRGVVDENLHPHDAAAIGQAFATAVQEKTQKSSPVICVGFDGRMSSPILEEALVQGLCAAGADVVRVGLGPTPMLYFATKLLKSDAGVMITGSHNPVNHNGFKLILEGLPFYGDQITELGERIAQNTLTSGRGSVSFEPVFDDYVDHLFKQISHNISALSIAWDPGNGAAGEVVSALVAQLQGTHHVINDEIDGSFPNHHPDPSVPENMQQLTALVAEKNCDIGIAFDGDGDRIGVVDAKGRILQGDQLMMIFAKALLQTHPGETIIGDVKASKQLFDVIAEAGGTPLIWKTGHSFLKMKMYETGAKLAGEVSGHMFFAENYGFDDAPFAAVKLLDIIAASQNSFTEMVDHLPQAYSTAEIRLDIPEARKFALIDEIKQRNMEKPYEVLTIDGIRVTMEHGWWLARASNTQAAIVLRCEADSQEHLEEIVKEVEEELALSEVSCKLL